MQAQTETRAQYVATRPTLAARDDDAIIRRAAEIMLERMRRDITYFTRPEAVKDYVATVTFTEEREVFGVLLLDAQNGLIDSEILFYGTVAQTSVYPREVVKAALRHNACAVIFFHNHPSSIPEPSQADKMLTAALKTALALVDVQTLDHIVAGGTRTVSFAERGLI